MSCHRNRHLLFRQNAAGVQTSREARVYEESNGKEYTRWPDSLSWVPCLDYVLGVVRTTYVEVYTADSRTITDLPFALKSCLQCVREHESQYYCTHHDKVMASSSQPLNWSGGTAMGKQWSGRRASCSGVRSWRAISHSPVGLREKTCRRTAHTHVACTS